MTLPPRTENGRKGGVILPLKMRCALSHYLLIIFLAFSFCLTFNVVDGNAYGIRTGFGKVIVEGVPLGVDYSMRRDSKFPLVIKNDSDETLKIRLDVVVPTEDEVQQGYEPIADISWITLEKDTFLIEPGKEAETDVIISVPDRSEYSKKRYHVFIWSRTVGKSLGVGIKSKLLFSTQ